MVMSSRAVPTIVIPDAVREKGICPPTILAEALKHLHHSGVVVLENVVDVTHLDTINSVMSPEATGIANLPSERFNFGRETGNINQSPPLKEEFLYLDVWANPFVLPVLAAMLGPVPVLHLATGNTTTLAEDRQPVHSDYGLPHPSFPFSFVVNTPLVDMTLQNGALEVWPGSHTATTFYDQVAYQGQCGSLPTRAIIPAILKNREAISPPARVVVPKGSVIIRDLRLWHAGHPNLTNMPRVMLAFVWQASWWQGTARIPLPLDIKNVINSWEEEGPVKFSVAAKWIDGEVSRQLHGDKDTDMRPSDPAMFDLFTSDWGLIDIPWNAPAKH
ncbi:hypothetical protein AA313_de0209540 [Arthrobotrys entomopaga]|nr:hypothetical protein AA313_de0209540 [Arthrobotrys entomopaga]